MGSRERGRELEDVAVAVAESQGSEGVAAGLHSPAQAPHLRRPLAVRARSRRFSKEYLSQIERGKTRPTAETVAWLAERLGIDADLLRTGISAGERNRWEAQLARAEALSERYEYAAAAPEFAQVRDAARATGAKDLELRGSRGKPGPCSRTAS